MDLLAVAPFFHALGACVCMPYCVTRLFRIEFQMVLTSLAAFFSRVVLVILPSIFASESQARVRRLVTLRYVIMTLRAWSILSNWISLLTSVVLRDMSYSFLSFLAPCQNSSIDCFCVEWCVTAAELTHDSGVEALRL